MNTIRRCYNISELATDVVKLDTPTIADIKRPVRAVKKTVGLIELGAGAVLEKQFLAPLLSKLPLPAAELNEFIEIIILGLANSQISQSDLSNLISGATISSIQRLSDKLIERVKSMMKIGSGVKLTGQPVIQQNYYENYTEGDAF